MKRTFCFIIAAVALMAASCSPLRIVLNSTDSTGARSMLTSNKNLMGNFDGAVDIALGSRIEKKDTILAVLITIDADSGHGVFNKGNQMKIRLNDDSVIELTNLYDKEYEEKEETYVSQSTRFQTRYAYAYDIFTDDIWVTPYTVSQMVPEVHTSKKSLSYALYLISKKQLNDIITKGVKKLRVEIENYDLDMPDPSGASATFKELYDFLRQEMNVTYKRTEF